MNGKRPYMDYPQHRAARRLVHECCNYDNGNCLVLDNGEPYNVVDSRYRSRKPLIVTTNLALEELQHPEDTAHARIYDRLLEMCCPVCITGENIRKATAQGKMERLRGLMNGKESL